MNILVLAFAVFFNSFGLCYAQESSAEDAVSDETGFFIKKDGLEQAVSREEFEAKLNAQAVETEDFIRKHGLIQDTIGQWTLDPEGTKFYAGAADICYKNPEIYGFIKLNVHLFDQGEDFSSQGPLRYIGDGYVGQQEFVFAPNVDGHLIFGEIEFSVKYRSSVDGRELQIRYDQFNPRTSLNEMFRSDVGAYYFDNFKPIGTVADLPKIGEQIGGKALTFDFGDPLSKYISQPMVISRLMESDDQDWYSEWKSYIERGIVAEQIAEAKLSYFQSAGDFIKAAYYVTQQSEPKIFVEICYLDKRSGNEFVGENLVQRFKDVVNDKYGMTQVMDFSNSNKVFINQRAISWFTSDRIIVRIETLQRDQGDPGDPDAVMPAIAGHYLEQFPSAVNSMQDGIDFLAAQLDPQANMEAPSNEMGVDPDDSKVSTYDISANDSNAQAILRSVSTSLEIYSQMNGGGYPDSLAPLLAKDPPMIGQDPCGATISGFIFSCDLGEGGYTISAVPEEEGITGTKTYAISTGGVLAP